MGGDHLKRYRGKGDLFKVGLDDRLVLHELRDGESRRRFDGKGVLGKRQRSRLPQHVDETRIPAIALAEGDRVAQDDACFFVHGFPRPLPLLLACLAQLGEMVFLPALDHQSHSRQLV